MAKLAQLKPYNPRAGFELRTYNYKGQIFSNEVPNRWYAVSDEVAEYLASVRNRDGKSDAPLAFAVGTYDQVKRYEEEQGRKLNADAIRDFQKLGGDLSTRDLPPGGRLGLPYGAVAAHAGGGLGDPNVDASQNHFRPGGSHASDRGPFETHGGDPNPAPAGQSPDMARRLGTPEQPLDTNSAKATEVMGSAAAQQATQGSQANEPASGKGSKGKGAPAP